MPEVVVHAVKGRSAEQKKLLMKRITEAVVDSFGVPADRVVGTIVKAEPEGKGTC